MLALLDGVSCPCCLIFEFFMKGILQLDYIGGKVT